MATVEHSMMNRVGDAPDLQRQVSLTRLDPHGLPERLVFEPARDVHDDVDSWQPPLAGAIDICVAALTQPDITADVVMPAAPQVVSGGSSPGVLRQAGPGLASSALETRQVVVAGVGDGEEWLTAPYRRSNLNLEPLPDRRGDDLASGKMKRVPRDGLPDGMTGWCARLEQPMRDDHPPRKPADHDRRRGAGQQQAPLRGRRLGPDQERQATQVHPPERNITRLITKNLHTGVADSGQVYWLIARLLRS